MWRTATERDDGVLVEMCLGLYREDPGPFLGDARHLRETLATLRREMYTTKQAEKQKREEAVEEFDADSLVLAE